MSRTVARDWVIEPRTGPGPLRGRSLLAAAFLAAVIGWTRDATAQQSWVPTVATAPGGSFYSPQVPTGRVQPGLDPRLFAARNRPIAPALDPLPQGAWSPIVTGAIPEPRDVAPVARSAPPETVIRESMPAPDAFSPIRPLATKALDTKTLATKTLAAPDAPQGAGLGSREADATADAAGVEPVFAKTGPLSALPPDATAAQQYCFNTNESAADARFAWQAKKIKEMEGELDKRAQQLEAKTEEYKRWLQRRDDFSRKAHEKLVGFYSRMRPDAAAVQLATLDEETAAAVVTKLETKVASQIMGEMDPERAAKIATIISGAAKLPALKRGAGQGGPQPAEPAKAAPQAEQPRS